jgi:hypothetical protein
VSLKDEHHRDNANTSEVLEKKDKLLVSSKKVQKYKMRLDLEEIEKGITVREQNVAIGCPTYDPAR